ncbi:Uncharacterised protein [Mycobacteroides abscessus subsp. abscessus]|nr:Uncharacterised protein [Mycobacteroides abscessus subsp. abscessus]
MALTCTGGPDSTAFSAGSEETLTACAEATAGNARPSVNATNADTNTDTDFRSTAITVASACSSQRARGRQHRESARCRRTSAPSCPGALRVPRIHG